jgi:hypothetical protein
MQNGLHHNVGHERAVDSGPGTALPRHAQPPMMPAGSGLPHCVPLDSVGSVSVILHRQAGPLLPPIRVAVLHVQHLADDAEVVAQLQHVQGPLVGQGADPGKQLLQRIVAQLKQDSSPDGSWICICIVHDHASGWEGGCQWVMTSATLLRCRSPDAVSQLPLLDRTLAAQTVPRSIGLLGVARANTAVGVSPETFLLLQK